MQQGNLPASFIMVYRVAKLIWHSHHCHHCPVDSSLQLASSLHSKQKKFAKSTKNKFSVKEMKRHMSQLS